MKILVFQQTGLPVSEGCGDVLEKLSQKAELQFVDTKGIMSGQFSGDYFFNAHGEYYPMEIEDSLFSFFAQGPLKMLWSVKMEPGARSSVL